MTNPDNVGGLLNAEFSKLMRRMHKHGDSDERYIWDEAIRISGELCRAAPAGGDVECFVREMRTSKGSEFFVVVKRDGRELTPHMYTERWKAEYDVASWQHLLCGAPKPDILAYGPSAPFASAPAGSGEVDGLARWWQAVEDDHMRDGLAYPDDHVVVRFVGKHESATLTAGDIRAALLRKLSTAGSGELATELSEALHADGWTVLDPGQFGPNVSALLRKLQQGADYSFRVLEIGEVILEHDEYVNDYGQWAKVKPPFLGMAYMLNMRTVRRAASQGQEGGHASVD